MNSGQHLCRALLLLTLVNPPSHSREVYLRDVPSPFACTTCHEDPRGNRQGANIRNGFGFDYVAERQEWARLCDLDSDGDGISNAIELLDPECEWRPAPLGQPNTPRPVGDATHPGDPNDPDQCGDGERQGGEECDGDELGESSCQSLGFLEGLLTCNQRCQFDLTDCVSFPDQDMNTLPDAMLADMHSPDEPTSMPDVAFHGSDAQIVTTTPDMVLDVDVSAHLKRNMDVALEPIDTQVHDYGHKSPIGQGSNGPNGCTQSSHPKPIWLVIMGVFMVRRQSADTFAELQD